MGQISIFLGQLNIMRVKAILGEMNLTETTFCTISTSEVLKYEACSYIIYLNVLRCPML